MSDANLLKSILKNKIQAVNSEVKLLLSRKTAKNILKIQHEALGVTVLISFVPSSFPEKTRDSISEILAELSSTLEQLRFERLCTELTEKLSAHVRKQQSGKQYEHLIAESKKMLEQVSSRVFKRFKQLPLQRTLKLARFQLTTEAFSGFAQEVEALNWERLALFDQIVKIIRDGRKEDLIKLLLDINEFYCLLEIFIKAGLEKGNRLLKVLAPLKTSLLYVCDLNQYRELLQAKSQEFSRSSSRVSDVQLIRQLTIKLGVVEAEALKQFHACFPPTLQVLKRPLRWSS